MKTQILLSSFLAIALTLTNSNIALSEENTSSDSKSDTSSQVCVDKNGNKFPCP